MASSDLKVCTRCSSDACLVNEVNETIKTYFCYGCGFQSCTLYTRGNDLFEQQFEVLPNLHKELMGEDEEGKIWMPITVNLPQKGMVFAHGTRAENWRWASVQAVEVKEEEKEKYPIPGKKGEFYSYRMDMDTLQEFDPEKGFIDALDSIGVFGEKVG